MLVPPQEYIHMCNTIYFTINRILEIVGLLPCVKSVHKKIVRPCPLIATALPWTKILNGLNSSALVMIINNTITRN